MVGVFTASIAGAFEIASQLMVGGVLINDSTDFRIDSMPFGGFGRLGRRAGRRRLRRRGDVGAEDDPLLGRSAVGLG